jgi:hypothetical protein
MKEGNGKRHARQAQLDISSTKQKEDKGAGEAELQ